MMPGPSRPTASRPRPRMSRTTWSGPSRLTSSRPSPRAPSTNILQAETKGVCEAGTKQTDFLQARTEGAKYEAGNKQTNILQAETEGVKNYKARTKQTDFLQAETEGAKYEAWTKQTDFLQAGTTATRRSMPATTRRPGPGSLSSLSRQVTTVLFQELAGSLYQETVSD